MYARHSSFVPHNNKTASKFELHKALGLETRKQEDTPFLRQITANATPLRSR